MTLVGETNFTDLGIPKRGKVRDVYDLGDKLLIVVTDRLSAFDVVLPTLIPDKGKVLNQLSLFWFSMMDGIVSSHVRGWNVEQFPDSISRKYDKLLRGRAIVAVKASPFPVECIVRGYLSGSAWDDYKEGKPICGITLPPGLKESDKLEKPIFTPTTKAETGHDVGITFRQMAEIIGRKNAEELRWLSIAVYKNGAQFAEKCGIIIADTKLEFGTIGTGPNKQVILIDEVLTPDSSRFWRASTYKPGRGQDSLDKQPVRDYLKTLDWDKTYPGPELSPKITKKIASRYREIFRILTECELS